MQAVLEFNVQKKIKKSGHWPSTPTVTLSVKLLCNRLIIKLMLHALMLLQITWAWWGEISNQTYDFHYMDDKMEGKKSHILTVKDLSQNAINILKVSFGCLLAKQSLADQQEHPTLKKNV